MSLSESVEEMREKLVQKDEWGKLATFVPNKNLPVYNWFYYKEGFARSLVMQLHGMFSLAGNDVVLDPFCGSGTTLLACKELGIRSIGYDVLPSAVFAAHTKTRNYGSDELRELAKDLFSRDFERVERGFPSLMQKAFSRYALNDIGFFVEILKSTEPKVRNFFVLALVNAALKCSYAWKDGAVIKIKRRNVPPLSRMYRRVVRRMIEDLQNMSTSDVEPAVRQQDARRLPLEDRSVDSVITSPPYLNQIDYTKVYEIENFIIESATSLEKKPGTRNYIGFHESGFAPEMDVPGPARAYFEDMDRAISEMYRVLDSGRAAVVVGNGYVEKKVVESDLILAALAARAGFDVERISVLNKRFALEERVKKKGVLRESMIILRK